MKPIISFILVLLVSNTIPSLAQQRQLLKKKYAPKKVEETFIDKKKILVGGNIGADASGNAFQLLFQPAIGYKITPNFHVGAEMGINYYQERIPLTLNGKPTVYKYKAPNWSLGLFARYFIANMFFVQAEPKINNVKRLTDLTYDPQTLKVKEVAYRTTTPSFLVGIGFVQGNIRDAHYATSILYDVIQNPNSPYYQTIAFKFGMYFPLFN